MTRYEFRRDIKSEMFGEGNLIEENESGNNPTKRVFRFEGRLVRIWNKDKNQWDGDGDKFKFQADSLQELYDKLPNEYRKIKKE